MGWDFSLSRSIGAMGKTMPFIVLRMLVYFGIALLYVFAIGGGGGVGYGIGSVGGGDGAASGGFYGALFGFVGASGLIYWGREYILYLVKAGHIAVLTHLYDDKELPNGRGQIDYAATVVKERFAEASILFALDQLIKGVLKFITGTLVSISALLPIPGLSGLMGILTSIVRVSLTYVDEIILAYNIRTGAENPWSSSADALVLYAQNYKTMIKNAVWLSLMMWLLTIVIFFVMLAPALALVAIFPGSAGGWGVAVAFVFAWSVKAAVIEPVAIYSLMQVYFKAIEGQEPDAEWRGKLESASSKFRDMKDKAANWVGGQKEADAT